MYQQVYTFSGGKVKMVANPQFNTMKNSYEVTFDVTSDIRPAVDDKEIGGVRYSFVKIAAIAGMDVNTTVGE